VVSRAVKHPPDSRLHGWRDKKIQPQTRVQPGRVAELGFFFAQALATGGCWFYASLEWYASHGSHHIILAKNEFSIAFEGCCTVERELLPGTGQGSVRGRKAAIIFFCTATVATVQGVLIGVGVGVGVADRAEIK
jgi:hypothetical protein